MNSEVEGGKCPVVLWNSLWCVVASLKSKLSLVKMDVSGSSDEALLPIYPVPLGPQVVRETYLGGENLEILADVLEELEILIYRSYNGHQKTERWKNVGAAIVKFGVPLWYRALPMFPWLKKLKVTSGGFTNVEQMGSRKRWGTFSFAGWMRLCNLGRPTSLSGLTHLTLCEIVEISHLSGIQELVNLEYLSLRRCFNFNNIGALGMLPRLASVDLSSTAVTELQPLIYCPLKELIFECWGNVSESHISRLKSLESISLAYGSMSSISFLAKLPKLKKVDVTSCYSVRDFEPLDEIGLEEVRMGNMFKLWNNFGDLFENEKLKVVVFENDAEKMEELGFEVKCNLVVEKDGEMGPETVTVEQ